MTDALIPALRAAGIRDERVLEAFGAIRREDFVPGASRGCRSRAARSRPSPR